MSQKHDVTSNFYSLCCCSQNGGLFVFPKSFFPEESQCKLKDQHFYHTVFRTKSFWIAQWERKFVENRGEMMNGCEGRKEDSNESLKTAVFLIVASVIFSSNYSVFETS